MKSKYILMNFMIATMLSIVNVYATVKITVTNKDFDTSKYHSCTLDFTGKHASGQGAGIPAKGQVGYGQTDPDTFSNWQIRCWTPAPAHNQETIAQCNAKEFKAVWPDELKFSVSMDPTDPSKVKCDFTNPEQLHFH